MGGGAPKDNSAKVAQIEANAAREAREAEERRKAAELQAFNERLSGAHTGAIQSALDYFGAQGLNSGDYADEIGARAAQIRSTIPNLDANPGSYYNNLGQMVYEAEQDALRSRMLREIDAFAPANFQTKRIADTADDAIIDSILEERYNTAENYVRNLLDRGVVTQSGYDAAIKDLARQRPGAKSQLSEFGLGELERGRSKLSSIVNDARSEASNLRLGQMFDPYGYSEQVNRAGEEFFTGLGERLRGAAPEDIFTTTGLAGIAGAAQGAQNTKFNPGAISGEEEDEEDEDEDTTVESSPF